MLIYAISAESSGPFPLPGQNNLSTELIALRIVDIANNKTIVDARYSRSDGQFLNYSKNSTTEDMVKGRPAFTSKANNLKPLIFHKDSKGNYDTLFICFGKGFYEELFRKYGLMRNGLFVDLLPTVRDLRDLQAIANTPSRSGSKLPTIDEVAAFMDVDWPSVPTPKDKTELIQQVFIWMNSYRERGQL